METDGDGAFGEKRRRIFADDSVGVIDSEDEIGDTVSGSFAVFATALAGGKFVGAEGVLGAKIARADS